MSRIKKSKASNLGGGQLILGFEVGNLLLVKQATLKLNFERLALGIVKTWFFLLLCLWAMLEWHF